MKHARSDYDDRIQDSAGLIPDDEPVLLIRGQDICAIQAIDAWIETAVFFRADPLLVEAVRRHRARVEKWQAEHPPKVPDAPPEILL